jgi:hypothetical protein
VKTVPYEPNLFVAFINHIDSLHSVTPRAITRHSRLLVSLAAELRFPLFRQPHKQSVLSFWRQTYGQRLRHRLRRVTEAPLS